MNIQLNEPWLTDMTPSGGCAAAKPAELMFKPDKSAESGKHSHLELRLGMPSGYPPSPDHVGRGDAGKGRATGHGSAVAALFAAHGASSSAEKAAGAGTRAVAAAALCFQVPCSSSSASPSPGLGTKRWFSEAAAAAPAPAAAGVRFVHPWSLAARQEKAVLEQAARAMVVATGNQQQQPAAASSTLLAAVSRPTTQQPPVVGWPPIRTYRKNVIANPRMGQKPDDDGAEKEPKKSKPSDQEEKRQPDKEPTEKPSSMFVKVNMEGFAVGRKIDLLAHDGYDSLSCALHKMFDNFLSVQNAKTPSENDRQRGATSPDHVLLYEDNEGDRMLVGDVPWEMFVSSVKRLYISLSPKPHGPEQEMITKMEGEATLT